MYLSTNLLISSVCLYIFLTLFWIEICDIPTKKSLNPDIVLNSLCTDYGISDILYEGRL